MGDALEYAYTIRGANPVLNGHYASRFLVQTSIPVDRQRVRVVAPSTKPLFLRQHLTDIAPIKRESDGHTECLWDFRRMEGIPFEDELPIDYEPYPYVELSDFENWSQVVEWALPLYSGGASNLPVDARALLTKWQREATSNEERARMALQFVQDELRYTAIELGPDSYLPAFTDFRAVSSHGSYQNSSIHGGLTPLR